MSEFVVVDASLAVKWLVEEEDSDKAHEVLESWVSQDITRVAPYLMPFEVANALHRRVVRGELSVGDSVRMIARLLGSRLELHQTPTLHAQGAGVGKPTPPVSSLRRPLSGPGRRVQLRVVDRGQEVPPSGSIQRERPLDRRIRLTGIAGADLRGSKMTLDIDASNYLFNACQLRSEESTRDNYAADLQRSLQGELSTPELARQFFQSTYPTIGMKDICRGIFSRLKAR